MPAKTYLHPGLQATDSSGVPVVGQQATVWTALTSGTQVTTLQTLAGSAITFTTSDSKGIWAFKETTGAYGQLFVLPSGGSMRFPVMSLEDLSGVQDFSDDIATALANSAAAVVTADATEQALAGLRFFSVVDYGAIGDGTTNDAASIQAALNAANAAGGGVVVFPAGKTYGISAYMSVYDDTTLWAYGATIKAIGNNGLLRNFVSGDNFPVYTGRSNITVLGGTWDANANDAGVGTVTSLTNALGFNHASDITVRDITILNVSSSHAVEFNSIRRGRVINCTALGFKDNDGGTRQFSEAFQIDLAKSGSVTILPYDGTPSIDILIDGCSVGPSTRLGSFGRGVGAHGTVSGTYFDDIRVTNCRIDDTIREGIAGYGWRRAVISGNTITSAGWAGIEMKVPDPGSVGYSITPHSYTISGNTIDGASDDAGIRVFGYPTARITGVSITGNTVRSQGVGHGIQVEQCLGATITGNSVDTTASAGILVHYGEGATVASNVIKSPGSNGVSISGCVSATVVGNHVDSAGSYGVFVGQGADATTNATDCVVSGNKIRKASTAGIRLSTNAIDCLVTGNQVRKDGTSTTSGISLSASATGAKLLANDLMGNAWSASSALSVSTAVPVTGAGGMTALPGSNFVDLDVSPLPALESHMRPSGRCESTTRIRCGVSSAITSGVLYLVPVWLPAGRAITTLSFLSGSTGATTPTNYWFALFNSSRVALARTADQTTTAWSANVTKALAIAQTTAGTASTYTTTYAGLHYLGLMVAASATPTIVSEGTCSTGADSSPGFGATNTGQTTPPTVTSGAFTAAAFSGAGVLAYGYTD